MAEPTQPVKKIFFNYSDQAEDVVMMKNLCLHFAVLKDKVSLWHKEKIIPGDDRKKLVEKNLAESSAAVHLLSIAYETQDDCTDILQRCISEHKKNIPVLLSSFDWESDDALVKMKDELLPQDHQPVDTHANFNAVYTEIVQRVKNDLFNDNSKIKFNQRGFYFALAGLVLIAGFFVSLWVNTIFDSISIALLTCCMFIICSLFVLRKIFFPVSVSTSKS